jgi:hypothetical protein
MDNSRVFYSEGKPTSRGTAENRGRGRAGEYSHNQFDILLSSSPTFETMSFIHAWWIRNLRILRQHVFF